MTFALSSPEQQRSLRCFIDDPSGDTWENIAFIIITAPELSVWEAVVAQDPTFPKIGRRYDADGNIVAEWERIPTPLEVLRAIRAAQGGCRSPIFLRTIAP